MLSMGHAIVWLARYEGLKVVLRTIIFNLFCVSFNSHPCSWGIVLRLGYPLDVFLWKFNRETNSDFPTFDGPNYTRHKMGRIVSPWQTPTQSVLYLAQILHSLIYLLTSPKSGNSKIALLDIVEFIGTTCSIAYVTRGREHFYHFFRWNRLPLTFLECSWPALVNLDTPLLALHKIQ
jgi:hypothetical protein